MRSYWRWRGSFQESVSLSFTRGTKMLKCIKFRIYKFLSQKGRSPSLVLCNSGEDFSLATPFFTPSFKKERGGSYCSSSCPPPRTPPSSPFLLEKLKYLILWTFYQIVYYLNKGVSKILRKAKMCYLEYSNFSSSNLCFFKLLRNVIVSMWACLQTFNNALLVK